MFQQIVYGTFLALIFLLEKSDGFEWARIAHCLFSSSDLHDMEFIDTYIFNKAELLRFNSTVGVYVGLTEHGISNAKTWNADPAMINSERAQVEVYCKNNAGIDYTDALDKTVKPCVKLSSVTPTSGRHPAMLMCSAYSFYPRQISVKWLRDGQPMTLGVTSTEEMADGDWYYQVHSHLEYTPKSGEKISCVVEHPSLEKAIVEDWDPSMPEAERNKIAIGASGLVLGLVLALAGFLYYKRKATGRILVPTN